MANNYINKFFGVSTASALAESGSVRRSTVTNKRFNPIAFAEAYSYVAGDEKQMRLDIITMAAEFNMNRKKFGEAVAIDKAKKGLKTVWNTIQKLFDAVINFVTEMIRKVNDNEKKLPKLSEKISKVLDRKADPEKTKALKDKDFDVMTLAKSISDIEKNERSIKYLFSFKELTSPTKENLEKFLNKFINNSETAFEATTTGDLSKFKDDTLKFGDIFNEMEKTMAGSFKTLKGADRISGDEEVVDDNTLATTKSYKGAAAYEAAVVSLKGAKVIIEKLKTMKINSKVEEALKNIQRAKNALRDGIDLDDDDQYLTSLLRIALQKLPKLCTTLIKMNNISLGSMFKVVANNINVINKFTKNAE